MKKIITSFYLLTSLFIGSLASISIDANSVYEDPDQQVSITFNSNGGSEVTDGAIEQTYVEYLKDNGEPLLNDVTRGFVIIADDIDLDGDIDILIGENDSLNGRIVAMENDGSGNFTRHLIKENVFVMNLVLVDVDQDGLVDIVASLSGSGVGSVVWLKRNSTLITDFGDPVIIDTVRTNTFGVDAADVDKDGEIEIISAQYVTEKVAMYNNDGSETFTKTFLDDTASSSLDPYGVGFADLNGDTYLDIYTAYGRQTEIKLFMNNQDGTFTPVFIPASNATTTNGSQDIKHVDMDNDGDIDLFVTARNASNEVELKWFENDGLGNFTYRTIGVTSSQALRGFSVGDLDGDGDIDVVTQISSTIEVWINDGAFSFTKSIITSPNLSIGNSTAIADFDGNGTEEIAVLGDGVTISSNLTMFGYGYFAIEPTDPIKDNAEFDGWYSDAALTTPFDFSKPIVGDVTAYAKWINFYDVNYELDGGNNSSDNVDSLSSTQSLTLSDPDKFGYTFEGWFLEATFENEVTELSNVNNDVTLYAKWSPIQSTITYELDGGVNNPGNITTILYDETAFMLLNPTRLGYVFKGWYFSDNTLVYGLLEVTQDITLYARWEAGMYDVVFNANGGIGSMNEVEMAFDSNVTLPSNVFVKTGYSFMGWNTASDGSGTAYDDASLLTMDVEGVTLYAQWYANTYDIAYDENGGTGNMANQPVDYDASVTLLANAFVRDGYVFNGWNTMSNGSGTPYNDASTFTMDQEGVTLYAQWLRARFTVTYELNGGINSNDNPSVYNLDETITLANPTKAGYIFDGWYTDSNFENAMSTLRDLSDDITLYAKFVDVTSPVIEGVTNNQVFESGSQVSITFNEGTATLNGEAYESGEEITEPGDYTLIVTDASNNVSQVQFTIESQPSLWWIFLLIGIIAAGGAYWFFVLKDKEKEEESNQNA